MRRFWMSMGALWALVLLLIPSALASDLHREVENPDITLEAELGYDGMITYGKCMPLFARVENHGSDLEASLAVNVYRDDKRYNRYEIPFELAQGAEKEFVLPIWIQTQQDVFTVEICSGEKIHCARNISAPRIINPGYMLIGALSPEPQNLFYFSVQPGSDSLNRQEFSQTIPLTVENFPTEPELMDAFHVLVVDGFDAGTLSARQQEVLRDWLREGHILIVGGGAQAGVTWPYFSDLTNLLPESISTNEDFIQAMDQYLAMFRDVSPEDEQSILLAHATGGDVVVENDGVPLIWRTEVGDGRIYTAAFELGESAIALWAQEVAPWQRLMVKDCRELYLQGFKSESIYRRYTRQIKEIPLQNDSALAGIAAVLVVVLFGGGAAAYLILKRMDKRQWLWAALPALALVAAGGMCVAAYIVPSDRPAAVVLSAFYQDAEGNQWADREVGVASPWAGEQFVSVDAGRLDDGDKYSTYYGTRSPGEVPTELNHRFVLGEQMQTGSVYAAPWRVEYYWIVNNRPQTSGRVESKLWMAEDGVYGIIHNATQTPLQEGALVSPLGFVSIPPLQPGETHELKIQLTAAGEPEDEGYRDGYLYNPTAIPRYNNYMEVVADLAAAKGEEKGAKFAPEVWNSLVSKAISELCDAKEKRISASYTDFSNFLGSFWYVSFVEDAYAGHVYLNGEEIERMENLGVACVEIPMEKVGETGIVCCFPGMEQPRVCALNADGTPDPSRLKDVQESYDYRSNETVCFMFAVDEIAGGQVEQLVVYKNYAPDFLEMQIYNGSQWRSYSAGVPLQNPEQYVDAQGRIFVRFCVRSGVQDSEVYDDIILAPALLLLGRGSENAQS